MYWIITKSAPLLIFVYHLVLDFFECTLYLSRPSRAVGKGICFNDLSAKLHNAPLPVGHCKVRVDFATEGDAPLPVPLERADIMTVR